MRDRNRHTIDGQGKPIGRNETKVKPSLHPTQRTQRSERKLRVNARTDIASILALWSLRRIARTRQLRPLRLLRAYFSCVVVCVGCVKKYVALRALRRVGLHSKLEAIGDLKPPRRLILPPGEFNRLLLLLVATKRDPKSTAESRGSLSKPNHFLPGPCMPTTPHPCTKFSFKILSIF